MKETLKTIGLWAFYIGLVLALANALLEMGDWMLQVLLILGIIAGSLHIPLRKNLVALGVIYFSIVIAYDVFADLLFVGEFITKLTFAWVAFLGPVVITTMLIWGGAFLFTGRLKED